MSADDLRADPRALGPAVGYRAGDGVVIAVDQLEELFTQCRDHAERRCFVAALMAAWREPGSAAVVILTLRADFYGRVASYPELAAAVVAHQALIGAMSRADMRRAIELPAARGGLTLQPGLAETMLDDLGDEPGALPLLSHALLETWKARRRLMLTASGYREAGGVRGAIAHTAEHTLASMSEADRAIARSIFLSLTDVAEGAEPTRRRVNRDELGACPAETLDRVLGVLAAARLVSVDERTVVVAHEALIRHWPRLGRWIDADREGLLVHRRMADAAREWTTLGRDPAALYRGARLAAALEWATANADDLSELEQEFLTAAATSERRELETARRRTRRLRLLAAGFAAATAIVAALAIWALGQRTDARREAGRATSLALATSSTSLARREPHVALLLGLEAYRASPRPQARSSVLAALAAARDPGVLAILHGHTDNVNSVASSADSRTLATSAGNTIRLWNTRTHKPLGAPLTGHTGFVSEPRSARSGMCWRPRAPTTGPSGCGTRVAASSSAQRYAAAGAAWRSDRTAAPWQHPTWPARSDCGTPAPTSRSARR